MPRSPIKVLGGLCQSPPNTLIGLRGVKDECPVSPGRILRGSLTFPGSKRDSKVRKMSNFSESRKPSDSLSLSLSALRACFAMSSTQKRAQTKPHTVPGGSCRGKR